MVDRVRRTGNARDNAEAAFKSVTTKQVAAAPKAAAPAAIPGARELVSLRIDRSVLEHFQGGGPGWQERINDALKATLARDGAQAAAAQPSAAEAPEAVS